MPIKAPKPVTFSRMNDEKTRDIARQLHDLVVDLKKSACPPSTSGLASNPIYRELFNIPSEGTIKQAVIEFSKDVWESSKVVIFQILEGNNVPILEQTEHIYRDSGSEVIRILVDLNRMR